MDTLKIKVLKSIIRLITAHLHCFVGTIQVITETGEVHELTGYEFKLLRCFLLHPEQVLSKSTLMGHVYDFNSDKDSNVIEVYINHLSQKLGKQRIETRRGQGYVFKEPSE